MGGALKLHFRKLCYGTPIEKGKPRVKRMHSMLIVHTGIKAVICYERQCSSVRRCRKIMGKYKVSKRAVRSSVGTSSEGGTQVFDAYKSYGGKRAELGT